jgi:DHA2 family multidrug resistance protein-like MFS transporter
MGAMMTVFLGGMAIAPPVGGLLLAHFWWGSALMGVPVMAVTSVVLRLIPESRAEAGPARPHQRRTLRRLRACSAFALCAVATGFDSRAGHARPRCGVRAVFLRRQATVANPLLDLGLIARPRVRRTSPLFLTALLMGGTSLFFNLYLQEVQGLSPLGAAWWMLPMMVSMIAAANIGPWLNRRFPQRTVVVSMMTAMVAGFVLYAVAPVSAAGRPVVAIGASLATFGIGAAFPMLMDGVMSAASPGGRPRALRWPSCRTSSASRSG